MSCRTWDVSSAYSLMNHAPRSEPHVLLGWSTTDKLSVTFLHCAPVLVAVKQRFCVHTEKLKLIYYPFCSFPLRANPPCWFLLSWCISMYPMPYSLSVVVLSVQSSVDMSSALAPEGVWTQTVTDPAVAGQMSLLPADGMRVKSVQDGNVFPRMVSRGGCHRLSLISFWNYFS